MVMPIMLLAATMSSTDSATVFNILRGKNMRLKLPPDYHTKIAILKAKSFREGISLPDDVINYIASKVVSNIRELEGTLISLIANATLTKRKITLSLAQELIDKIVSTPKNDISVSKIKKTVCDYFGITPELNFFS